MTAPAEVIRFMPDPFDPRTLTITKAQAADRAAEDLNQERAQRARNRLGRRNLSQTPHQLTEVLSGRAQRKAARDYAERWWQAVRTWDTRTRVDLTFPTGSAHTSGSYFEPVTMGQSSSGNMVGDLLYAQVSTPMGWVSEAALGKELGRHATLANLRNGGGIATLIHHSGRGWADPSEAAKCNARAILTIADRLGDDQATTHQRNL